VSVYGKLILRIGLGGVFIYFGLSQIINPERWTALLPEFVSGFHFIRPESIVFLNGVFDFLIGFSFILGFFLKIVSVVAFLHLISIVIFSLGWTPIGVRDLGLALAALSLFFGEEDGLSLDYFFRKEKGQNQ
jgi:uncharacterized membrane protein YphA (DoxX/SURF4 family)